MSPITYTLRRASLVVSLSFLALLSGCSGTPVKRANELPAVRPPYTGEGDAGKPAIEVYDPFEGFNRGMYRFNAGFDKYVFLPVVGVYEAILPEIVQTGISNFFSNIFEFTNFTNAALQLKPKEAVGTLGRFAINSTVGVLGFIDVASKMGLYEHDEDFGQTLGRYGVGNGPYLILPIIGPSNLRDTTGLVADSAAFNAIDPFNFDDHEDRRIAFDLLYAIDKRHRISFRYYDTGSPFEYELVRMLYTKKRELDIAR